MPTEQELQQGFRIGDWEFYPSRGVFVRDSQEVRPEPLTWRVLIALARRDGQLVSKQELIKDAWDGRVVSDDPITRAIAQLRRNLGDSPRDPQYIETLHRRGYRLIENVELLQSTGQTDAESDGRTYWLSRKPLLIGVLVVAALVTAIGLPWIGGRSPVVDSIAILPFDNLSGDPGDEYIASGFRTELVQSLHGVDKLIVKNGRVRYDKEVDDIADMLEVDSVLTGTLRRSGDTLIVSYEISKYGIGVVHEGEIQGSIADWFLLQEKLGNAVRKKLGGRQTQQTFKSRSDDSDAYKSYMRGMYNLEHRGEPGNLEDSIAAFETAIQLDADYGPSYLALASSYLLMHEYRGHRFDEMSRMAVRTVKNGVARDPAIENAAGAIYGFIYYREMKWAASEQAHLRAVNARLVDANSFNWYSRMLASVGRLDASLKWALRALEIDPNNAILNSRVAIVYTWLGDSERASQYFGRANDLGAGGVSHALANALLLAREGNFVSAQNLVQKSLAIAGGETNWVTAIFAALADPDKATDALRALDDAWSSGVLDPQINLVARSLLGDTGGAVQVAERLRQPGRNFEIELLFSPELAEVRKHPGFLPLLNRLGVTEYWRERGCRFTGDRAMCSELP